MEEDRVDECVSWPSQGRIPPARAIPDRRIFRPNCKPLQLLTWPEECNNRRLAPYRHFESERKRNMRKLGSVCAFVAVFAGLALAENFTGRLLDAACYDRSKTAKGCDANSSTTQFLLAV